ALYEAKYDAIIANKATENKEKIVSIAGKCCESGDMLIWDLKVPQITQGDILAVFSTGAYGYSMANNYNRIVRPAIVFVYNGKDQIFIILDTMQDLVKYDLHYS